MNEINKYKLFEILTSIFDKFYVNNTENFISIMTGDINSIQLERLRLELSHFTVYIEPFTEKSLTINLFKKP